MAITIDPNAPPVLEEDTKAFANTNRQKILNDLISTEKIHRESIEQSSKAVTDFNTLLSSSSPEALNKTLSEQGSLIDDIINGFEEADKKISTAINNIGVSLEGNAERANLFTSSLAILDTQILKSSTFIDEFKNTIGASSATGFKDDIKELGTELKKIPDIGSLADKIIGGVEKFYQATEATQKFENSLIGLNAQFAGFGDSEKRLGFIRDLDKQMTDFVESNKNLANATGLSTTEVTKYTQKLMEIPGLYGKIIDLQGQGVGSMSALEAATRVARGTTGNFTDAFDSLNLQFRRFGDKEGRTAIDVLAQTYSLSQQLGISFIDTKGPVTDITKELAAMGNNTEGVIRLMSGLGRSLLEIKGVGVDVMSGIIKSVTDRIEGMNIAQKAFLSSQTGGSGGLRGAYEIDMLAREGKTDEIYKKMEQSLRQEFGGRIVTLGEASQNEGAAGQMTKQVAFLMEGPFGQMVRSQGEAYRLLEAFQKGTAPTMEKTQNAMGDAFKADSAIQDRQSQILQIMSNNINASKQYLQIIATGDFRKLTGGGSTPTELSTAMALARGNYSAASTNAQRGLTSYESPAQTAIESMSNINSLARNINSLAGGEHIAGLIGRNAKNVMSENLPGPNLEYNSRKNAIVPIDVRTGKPYSSDNVINIHVTGELIDHHTGNKIGEIRSSVQQARFGTTE